MFVTVWMLIDFFLVKQVKSRNDPLNVWITFVAYFLKMYYFGLRKMSTSVALHVLWVNSFAQLTIEAIPIYSIYYIYIVYIYCDSNI